MELVVNLEMRMELLVLAVVEPEETEQIHHLHNHQTQVVLADLHTQVLLVAQERQTLTVAQEHLAVVAQVDPEQTVLLLLDILVVLAVLVASI